MKKTKIVCTLGPATEDKKTIKQLIQAGMNCARLNFSHGTYEQFEKIINNLRELSDELEVPLGIIQDLQGPKIRLGELPIDGVQVKRGEKITLHTGDAYLEKSEQRFLPIQYKDFPKDVEKGDPILVDDGKIELEALGTNLRKTQIECEVKNDGILKSNKGINAPKTKLSLGAMTEKDFKDLEFGIKMDVDYVALSFVRTPEDIELLKNKLKEATKKDIGIISKIERPEAMQNLEEIIKKSDAVMVARGDLGIEIPASKVPIAQKLIIDEANKQGKPVITATHVLNSMVESPKPTRAEISDAANAIFDHTDAIMLSNETAVGKYPVEACSVLNSVANEIEKEIEKHDLGVKRPKVKDMRLSSAVALNAVELSEDIDAKYITALTNGGYTARQVAERRPSTEIIVFTPNKKTQNKLSLVWGLNNIYVMNMDFKNPQPLVKAKLEELKLIQENDEVVICNSVKGKKQRLITTFVV